MSGIDDPGAPEELPAEYADTYRDAYLRALAEQPEIFQAPDFATAPPAERPRSSWRLVALVLGGTAVLIGCAYGLSQLLVDNEPDSGRAKDRTVATPIRPTPSESEASPPSSPDQWEGQVAPVVIEAATANCTMKPGVDSANRPVRYDVENAFDADPTTAWRCEGRAIGETLTFTLPGGTEIGEVGLIPGYAKTDATSGDDRYAENNRIIRARWTFEDGSSVIQEVDPDPANRVVQLLRVPRTVSGTVTLRVEAVERGSRNTTAISGVVVGAVSP